MLKSGFVRYAKLLKILLKGNIKSFNLELKLWGPKFYQRHIQKKYCEGFKAAEAGKIADEKLKNLYLDFCAKDYAIIQKQYDLVEYVNNATKFDSTSDQYGRTKTELEMFGFQELIEHSSPNVVELLKLIYGRNFWVRGNAFVMEHSANKAKDHIQADWHVDGYNQVTLTLLLEESEPDAVATEIIPGSSKDKWSFDRSSINSPVDFSSHKFTGCKGDLFIFFGGGALHRSYIGSSGRKALFLNLSSGWYEAGIL